jgi:hypothetical protein
MKAVTRRFPAPWSVHELEQAFRIADANGQAVAYTYFRRDENEARQANVLTYDEARRIAANIECPWSHSRNSPIADDRPTTLCATRRPSRSEAYEEGGQRRCPSAPLRVISMLRESPG